MPAIEVSGLSKRYVIQHESRHDNLRDTLHHSARKLWRKYRWGTSFNTEEFWALRDVSFAVQPGEVVGIIGRNGAGKSTLLKILSRITEPTAGKVTIRGRVASLLEVGTGFHPELSGRENIFLNGAILGMSRAEIRKKFDEIVAFSEVEKFIDTPVKRYSSGMYVRLAFAVAAHLDPEILIVDEVLAVGDAQFQKKCLGKMQDVARGHGRTVLFVSHNSSAIRHLCSRALWLSDGKLHAHGPTNQILQAYHQVKRDSPGGRGMVDLATRSTTAGNDTARLLHVGLFGKNTEPQDSFGVGEAFTMHIRLEVLRPLVDFIVGFTINTQDGQPILCSNHYDTLALNALGVGHHTLVVRLDTVWLSPGTYSLSLAISRTDHQGAHDAARDALFFTVEPRVSSDSPASHIHLLDPRPGLLRPPLVWKIQDTA